MHSIFEKIGFIGSRQMYICWFLFYFVLSFENVYMYMMCLDPTHHLITLSYPLPPTEPLLPDKSPSSCFYVCVCVCPTELTTVVFMSKGMR